MRFLPARPRYPTTLAVLGAAAGCLLFQAPASAQLQPSPALQEAYFAWDEGDYLRAMEGYLAILEGPEGEAWVREVALLTGELHPVREVDEDGRRPSFSPDGSHLLWERELGDGWVTRIGPLAGGGHWVEVRARDVALSARGTAAWLEDGALRLGALDGGSGSAIPLPGFAPVSLRFAPDDEVLYLVTEVEGEGDRLRIARASAPGWEPELLDLGPSHASDPFPVAGGRYLVFTRPEEVGIVDLQSGRVASHPGRAPAVARGGAYLAFLQEGDGGQTLLRGLALSADGAAIERDPDVLYETSWAVDHPAVSPDGNRVAFQAQPHTDWEIYTVGTSSGAGEARRVTWEIQHDLFPAWVTDTQILAMKGEFRHRRAHLYDVGTGESYELFHNNTLRTIAPQYEWVVHPHGEGILINAERDGNTISPEQGVYWVDLGSTVSHGELVARLRENLAGERELLETGWARFAPLAQEIRPVADVISVGRIHHYAADLYAFGSKFVTEPGNALAREYLRETLESWGYEVELQWFEATGRGQGTRTANVVATLAGTENPEQVYVISSHFDSVLSGPGADDNSSATTALLEAARVLAEHPRRATIQFAFLTAEEAGLLGAREFVRRAQQNGVHIAGILNNDMVGWTRSHRLDNTIRYSNDGIRDMQHAAAHFFSDLITYDARYYRSTDAAAFFDAYGDIVGGIGSYPVLGNPNYHRVTDQLETIDHRLVAEVSRTTVASIMLLADGPSRIANLRLAESTSGGGAGTVEWDPSPEAGVVEYRVRVEGSDGAWHELAPVTGPRAELPAGVEARQVEVRARFADGIESFDGARLSLIEAAAR
ncbi:MAG: M20/M25/M40 family metallo-hydrolase [Gemmatimonadota bacterium]